MKKVFIDTGAYTLLRYDVGHKRAVEFGVEIKYLEKKPGLILSI